MPATQGNQTSGPLHRRDGDSRSIAARVAVRLRRSGYRPLAGVKCQVRDGIVVLSGTLPTFHLKQLAQELAGHTQGVHQIENLLHVTHSPKPVKRRGGRMFPSHRNLDDWRALQPSAYS